MPDSDNHKWMSLVAWPLTWPEAERALDSPESPRPGTQDLLRFLNDPSKPLTPEHFLEGYEIISEYENSLPVDHVPDSPQILTKLVWPLRHAKASFMLGNHLGAIALCGMIGEMVAILCWEMEEFQPRTRYRISLPEFERKGQQGRVYELSKAGIINPMLEQWFDKIRETRREHLHFFSKSPPNTPADALICYRIACGLVSWIIGCRAGAPAGQLNPGLLEWLDRKGLMTIAPPDAPPTV